MPRRQRFLGVVSRTFCKWLTKRERDQGAINHAFVYRLPEDREWSAAVGLVREPWRTPWERSGKARKYPWGGAYPPPRGAGNYHPSLAVDDFRETAPVASFAANPFGIYDLGGNVWEWCLDRYDRESGGCCGARRVFNDDDDYLLSSYRDKRAPDNRRNNNGIRLVLSMAQERDPWFWGDLTIPYLANRRRGINVIGEGGVMKDEKVIAGYDSVFESALLIIPEKHSGNESVGHGGCGCEACMVSAPAASGDSRAVRWLARNCAV